MSPEKAQAYWRENISMIIKLLTVWFIFSFGCGIIFINELNTIEIIIAMDSKKVAISFFL